MANLLNQRRYTPTDAARLVGLHPSTVRRWLQVSPSASGGRTPVVRDGGEPGLVSFLDLVELDMLRRLREKGVSTHALIRAAQEATECLQVDHPFVRRGVRVAPGKRTAHIYLPMPAESEREGLLHLGNRGQMALAEVVEQISELLDYDLDGLVRRWWPEGRAGGVVVDPEVGFGEPVVTGTRIHADVLFDMVEAEDGDVDRVAQLYEIPPQRVNQAIAFVKERRSRFRKRAA
jgi:uncharacterized protein (DUF433 family)